MTSRRMVYAQIANAVLAGLPEPEWQSLNADCPDGPYLFLNFDSYDDARLWARWLSPECVDSERWQEEARTRSVWYWGERPGDEDGWGWNIVGREPLPTVEQVTIAALSPDSLPVRCPRCGHDEAIHEDADAGSARCCLDCAGFCSPRVLVPAHVQGWAIDGRAK